MKEEIIMQHDTASVKRLSVVQFNTFSAGRRYALYALALLLILFGFGLIYDFGTPARYFFLAPGCILLVNVGASAGLKADKTLAAIRRQGGRFPCTKMLFGDSSIRITEEDSKSRTMKYGDILRLAEDREYYYLFVSTEAAYMVPKNQLHDSDAFRKHLMRKTNMDVSHQTGLLSLRLRDLTGRGKK